MDNIIIKVMRKKQQFIKYRVVIDNQTNYESNCLDFILYCDSVDEVYKLECRDYISKLHWKNGNYETIHRPVDSLDVVNIYINKCNDMKGCNMHYNIILMDLVEFLQQLNGNINIKDKVSQISRKYHLMMDYKIMKQ